MNNGKRTAFDYVNGIVLTLLALITLYPFLQTLLTSFASYKDVAEADFLVVPWHFTFDAYRYIFAAKVITKPFLISAAVTIFGTLFQLLMTTIGAYVLSSRTLPFRKVLMTGIIFTMFFGGGVIPFFLILKGLGMYNSLWGLFIPFGINTFNMILLRNFFANIPEELVESSKLDGANDFVVLFRIVMPLSLAGIATIALFYFVERWNDWYWPMLLLKDEELYPLSLKLRNILSDLQSADYYTSIGVDTSQLYSKGQDAASIVVSILPILCVYPFVQKYFVKGVMLGSVKS